MVWNMGHLLHRESAPRGREAGLAAISAKADAGDVEAQLSLGLRYGNAVGDTADFGRAAHWFRKAADQHFARAQYLLGVMFAHGQGVTPDHAISEDWLRKAAEGGDAGGQHEFGMICYRASLDPIRADRQESRLEAYKWLHLAAAQGYRDSTAIWELVTMSMTRAEITEGNRRASAFVARPSRTSLLS